MSTEVWLGAARWVRTIGHRAGWLLLVLTVLTVTAAYCELLLAPWRWLAGVVLLALAATIPLAELWAVLPGETWLEQISRQRRQARNRLALAELGFTPEEYLAAIPEDDVRSRLRAEQDLGLKLTPEGNLSSCSAS